MADKRLHRFLTASKYIDSGHSSIVAKAEALAEKAQNEVDLIKACFEYVRDDIKHSQDFQLNPVTVVASDVLKFGTGYCYAKSHLLTALLRASQVPAGLCYQRLTIEGDQPPFCLHGLNAVYLEPYGWLRLDPRGNKSGIDAQFKPPNESLAFAVLVPGEGDAPYVYAEPLSIVTDVLEHCETVEQVAASLPDCQLNKFPKPESPIPFL